MDFSDQVVTGVIGASHWRRSGHSYGKRWRESMVNYSKSNEAANAVVAACEEAGAKQLLGCRCFRRCRLLPLVEATGQMG